ncbi:MAG: nucleotidyl transferase AbiEii/AbiGii toxin family protein, partial [Saprospiraceae bacterium]
SGVMHTEIFNSDQAELLPFLKSFNKSFYLVGGTAIALHLGHRRSVDFDLFAPTMLVKQRIKTKLLQIPFPQIPIFEDYDQLHLLVNNVKVTFFTYPYPIAHPVKLNGIITMPTLLSLAAMKAFALGRRAKWKDYVDMYFLLHNHFTIAEISRESEKLFQNQFSEKLFRQQLAYHQDIDFTEPVEFIGEPVPENIVKDFLTKVSIDFL